MVLVVADAPAEYVDDAAASDLPFQAGEKLTSGGVIVLERERCGYLGLGCIQERGQLDEVHAVAAVIVGRVALEPSERVRMV